MKKIVALFLLMAFAACDDSDKTDNEKSESKIEIKTDSAEVQINKSGVSVSSKEEGGDSVTIKINSKDGIKIEGKDGKVELKTDDGGKIKIEKKGKDVNIQLKEN